jgi:hypothetical protein
VVARANKPGSVGRYVSNAAGRNKGGAPIEIDELIGEQRQIRAGKASCEEDGPAGQARG